MPFVQIRYALMCQFNAKKAREKKILFTNGEKPKIWTNGCTEMPKVMLNIGTIDFNETMHAFISDEN